MNVASFFILILKTSLSNMETIYSWGNFLTTSKIHKKYTNKIQNKASELKKTTENALHIAKLLNKFFGKAQDLANT